MRSVNCAVLSAADDVTRTGGKVDSNQLYKASFQTIFGDTSAAGTIKIQMSNDTGAQNNLAVDFTPTNWSDIPSATATVTAGVVAPILIDLCYRWIRVVFTQSNAGSTTVVCNMNAQGF